MFIDTNFAKRLKSGLAGATALGLIALANPASAASLLQYDFSNNTGITSSEAPSLVATNLTGTNFTRGSGLTGVSATDGFNSSGWGAYASNANDYLAFGINVATGYTASVNQLSFSSQRSGTGPTNLAVFAAVDGGAFTQIATFAQSATDASRILNFTAVTGVSSVLFRIVATSTTQASGGTFRVENYTPSRSTSPFSLNGDVSKIVVAAPSVPEPATWAMMIGGLGLVGGAMRRKRKVSVSFA